jgi:hypothetical protein
MWENDTGTRRGRISNIEQGIQNEEVADAALRRLVSREL